MFKRAITAFLALAIVICMLPALSVGVSAETGYERGYSGAMAGDGKIYAHGLDVSAWQESGLNFQNFANAGYDYVILRCGTSYGKDTCFEEYYASAKAAGLDVGCYYYSYATSVSKAQQEARDMISWMGNKKFEYPIYFDYEDPSQSSIGGGAAAQICYAFMDTLRNGGYLVGLYSMASWLEKDWVTSSGLRNKYEGWVAHLTTEANNSGISSGVYDDLLSKYGRRYGMHQYSFSTWVNGCGPFDANVSFKDYPKIVKTYGFNGYSSSESWIEQAAFDPVVYRGRYDDLKDRSDAQLKEHWLKFGIKEGRAASTILDLKYYVENNPDLKQAFGTDYEAAYKHFITKGYKEYRKFAPTFDGKYYCDTYPDVAKARTSDFIKHYIDHGMAEGRRASATFDVHYYLFTRPDVASTWPGDLARATRHYAGYGVKEGREGYDSKLPVISDVVFSNISSQGYTVTCKVTDNWGVSSVAFPTWTVANDQDDLPENFMNTQLGTKNGDTYTFQVKTSDHNNELGFYATHIYAKDKGGNVASLSLEAIEVKDQGSDQITLKVAAFYQRQGKQLTNVAVETTVSSLLTQFENETLEVCNSSGRVITGSKLVGTGSVIKLYSGTQVVDSVTVVVLGDVDGNGSVDSTDYMRIKNGFLGSFDLDAAQISAADVDKSGDIDATDYMRIKSQFLGAYNLYG